ncbi:MAG: Gfo/Idh/MocA family oxidoreductase [Chloroflexi bacterium]|nr:Gfo/Idh/MocA family oxidoreductase [Chloroflexota bacterium]
MLKRWGIIGIGAHADRAMCPAISKSADTKLLAVCSRSLERARSFASKHGAERAYDSLKRMLEDPELDVLYIATPNSLHAEHTIQAAEAGKHVLCEKPMALMVPECENMIQACSRNRVKLGINFQNRYHPAHIEARRLIQSGKVGEITVAKAQYCVGRYRGYYKGWRSDPKMAGSGALAATGLHAIDILRFLLNSEIDEVRALVDEGPPGYHVDNMIYVILRFANRVDAVVISGMLVPRSDNDVILYGSEAKITCKQTLGVLLEGRLLLEGNSLPAEMTFPTDNPATALYTSAVEAFNKCIEENTEPVSSGYDGLEMVRIANAILESGHQGEAIKIMR